MSTQGAAGSSRRRPIAARVSDAVRSGSWRTDGRLALHVLEALVATERSVATGTAVEVTSRVEPAQLLPTGWRTDVPDAAATRREPAVQEVPA